MTIGSIKSKISNKSNCMSIKKIEEYSKLRHEGDSTINQRLELLTAQQNLLLKQQEQINQHLKFIARKIETYKRLTWS